MRNDENVTCWVDCWRSSLYESDILTDEIQAERWNKRADFFAKDVDEERREKKNAEFFALLNEAGFSPKGSKILDIGCGPGSLSIPLARAGAEVTSLDISTGMLGRLMQTAEEEGLHITPVECSWWTADIDRLGFRNAFDLVIASMTPGIRDDETFNRMIACSKKYCYYSNFIRKDPEKIPTDIYVRILGKAPKNNIFAAGLLYPFMYLYTLGFHPIIRLNHKSVLHDLDWAEAAENTIDILQVTEDLSDEIQEKIREFYKDNSINGRYNADYEKYSGMIIWSVDKHQ